MIKHTSSILKFHSLRDITLFIALCVTYMQSLPLSYRSLTLLERIVRVNTVSPKFVRASSKGTNVQTVKISYTTERLVKIVLIARVSCNKYV